MGESNTSQEVTQCSSVSAVNNRSSRKEFLWHVCFQRMIYFFMVHANKYCLLFGTGQWHPSRRWLHDMLMGPLTGFIKGGQWQALASGGTVSRLYTLRSFYLSRGEARIQFRTLVLAFRAITETPSYFKLWSNPTWITNAHLCLHATDHKVSPRQFKSVKIILITLF